MEGSVGLRASDLDTVGGRLQEVPPSGAPQGAFARVGFTLAVLITGVAVIFSAVMIWLCLTQPFNVADVIGRGEIAALFRAVAAILISAVERAAHYL